MTVERCTCGVAAGTGHYCSSQGHVWVSTQREPPRGKDREWAADLDAAARELGRTTVFSVQAYLAALTVATKLREHGGLGLDLNEAVKLLQAAGPGIVGLVVGWPDDWIAKQT